MPQGNLAAEERLRWLGEQLAATGSVTVTSAAAALGVSEMTIRRDLRELEQRGTARRVRGGALPIGPQVFAERHRTRPRAKARIARKLLDVVPLEGVVAFDASSTVMRAASSIVGARDLLVLTNGPDTFDALHGRPGITPMLTGGVLDARTGSLVGPLACRAAAELAVTHFVTSAAAVDDRLGATEATIEEAEVKRSLASAAGEVVLAVDSSKLGSRAAAVALPWDRIDVLVTELDPTDARLAPYRSLAEIL